jgi:hypothetical protein
VGETISLSIGALESSKNVKISTQCSDKEEMRFAKILGGFQNVFGWSYEDLCGFDPGLTQHVIRIKEGIKPDRQKHRHMNSAFKATFQRQLENFLNIGIIFPVYSELVSNWVPFPNTIYPIRTCISFQTFSQAIMRNPFSPLNMEMILHQFVRSHLRPLLEKILGYSKIKGKGADVHKTTLNTNSSTMTYKCLPSGLLLTIKIAMRFFPQSIAKAYYYKLTI